MTRFSLVHRMILDERLTGLRGLIPAFMILALAAIMRGLLQSWVSGAPFLTFFPSVLITALLLGWRWGALALAASAVIANYAFQAPYMALALGTKELVSTVGFLLAGALMISAAEALRRSVKEIAEAAVREAELNLELMHRVNNNLAVIQSLAAQTARSEIDVAGFQAAFTARLLALSEANKVLTGTRWEASPMPDLADAALAPFLPSGQIQLSGPPCALPASACVPLVLALHELATNATKYGALSTPLGEVRFDWVIDGPTFRARWQENGGPTVVATSRKGLGSRLLRPQSGIAGLELQLPPAGAVCDITVNGAEAR